MKKPPAEGSGKRVGIILVSLFFFAMIMGAGPGIYLINGKGPVFGVPIIYAWVVFWFLIQASAVIIAFKTVWKR